MSKTRAIVFANGECSATELALAAPESDDLIVCVDGGLRHCLAFNLQPGLLVGDMDSASASQVALSKKAHVECVKHPPEKDASDLQLALELLSHRGITRVVLLGISGGRTDHTLFNWMLAGNPSWRFSLQMIDATVSAELVSGELPYKKMHASGTTLSLLPLGRAVEGVVAQGVKYPLFDARLQPGDTYGLSNEASADPVEVNVGQGRLLVIVSH